MNIGNYQRQLSDWMKYKRYAQNSIDAYVPCVGIFLKYFENVATKPSEISAKQIKQFLTRIEKPNTHKAYLSAIKLFYDKIGHQPNKLDRVEYPKQEKRLPIVLSHDEIQRMFNVCNNTKHRVILGLLYATGMRRSELINLKWCNIDRSRGIINIIQAKGNKDRQAPLPDVIIKLLEKYYHEYRPKEYVLNGQFDSQYSESSVLNVIKQLATKANINKRAYTHLIRHCAFTHMVEMGVDINKIKEIAGHNNVKTTMIYVHMSDNIIRFVPSPINSIQL